MFYFFINRIKFIKLLKNLLDPDKQKRPRMAVFFSFIN